MGVFSELQDATSGRQDITKNFLKTKGFKKIYWGAISKQGDLDYLAYELYIEYNGVASAELYYFPPTFKGYVADYNMKGIDPAGRCIGWLNSTASDWTLKAEPKTKFDISCYIKILNEKLKEYYGEW